MPSLVLVATCGLYCGANRDSHRKMLGGDLKVINSGRMLKLDAGICGTLVCFLMVALFVGTIGLQAVGAETVRPGDTELVSGRLIPLATAEGTVMRPDLAVSGQVLVRLYPGTPQGQIAQMLEATGTSIEMTYPDGQLLLLKLSPGQSVAGAVRILSDLPEVAMSSPDRLMYSLAVPSDPLYGMQWHHPAVQTPEAWDLQTGSPSTVVAVIDNGVDLSHPDLAGRVWRNPGETVNGRDDDANGYVDDVVGWNFVDRNNNPQPEGVLGVWNGEDNGTENGEGSGDGSTSTSAVHTTQMPLPVPQSEASVHHGTHAAGIIAARANNGMGVAGINWNCQIMSLKVVPDEGDPRTSDCLAAIQYAVDKGADIIYLGFFGAYSTQYTPVIAAAVEAGATVIAPAPNVRGAITNDPRSWWSPICNDGESFTDNNVIGVGGTDSDDRLASFSARDDSAFNFIDLMAPAVNIYSILSGDPEADEPYATAYGTQTGNSFAAAVVAGVASLVAAHFPEYGPAQIVGQLKMGATNIDEINPSYIGQMGAGRVNAYDSLRDLPPRLPRGIQAYDTPNDDGGSITVEWSLSEDDGGGFNDVVGYRVQRSDDSEGESGWLTLADVDAGIGTYVDTPVEDHRPYYYRISVRDQSTELFSDPVGPAMARDDTPPPAVEESQLVARDVIDSEGSAISVTWSGYNPPPDFGSYRIWRAQEPFTSVAGMEPIATVIGATTRQYTDNTAVNGKPYYYAVTVRDTALPEPNEITQVVCVGSVIASPNLPISFGAGLHMIALPARTISEDMADIFDAAEPSALRLARWNPALGDGGQYVVYSDAPASSFLRQELGRGFWYRTSVSRTITLAGIPVAEGNIRVPLRPGWNQLGNPYISEMPMAYADADSGAKVHVLGRTYSLREAADRGYVRDYVWRYDPLTNSYRLISSDPTATWAEQRVPRNAGFFVLAFQDAELELPNPAEVSPASVAVPAPVVDDNHWAVRLVARTDNAADLDNFIGVHPQAERLSGVASPPLLEGSVDLTVATGGGNPGATAFVQSLEGVQSWQVCVTCAEPGRAVELSWPDLTQVPADRRVTLRDLQTGRSVNMRTTAGYSFRLDDDQAGRQFELVVAQRGGAALAVTGLQVAAGAGVSQIAFTLSQDAAVEVQVLNIAGRAVRTVAADSVMSAGANVATWNQRSDSGARVPAGRYLITVTARGEDGSVARAVSTVSLGQ
jgi:subtilisin family serine protease